MIYECLVCGESFTKDNAACKDGYMACPVCQSEDIVPIWDSEHPPTSVEEFGLKEVK